MTKTASATLDTVQIEIESNASKAYPAIDSLTNSLSELKKGIDGGFGNLSRLSTHLDSLSKSSKDVNKMSKRLSGLTDLSEKLKPLTEIPSAKGFSQIANGIEKLQKNLDSITPEGLEIIEKASTKLADKLRPLAMEMGKISDGFTAMKNMAKLYAVDIKGFVKQNQQGRKSLFTLKDGLSVVSNATKKTSALIFRGFTLGGRSINSMIKPTRKAVTQIKQIGMALLSVRSIFTLVRKAINEYIQMDGELQSSLQNTWRAMGAQLAPAVEKMERLFHQFVRVIYSVIYALTGIDLIARANAKALNKMGASAKSALGNLQKFDDLNVVEFDKGTGDNNLIDMEKIDLSPIQKVIDWVLKMKEVIKDALNTGEWETVGKVFGEGINMGLTTFVNYLPIIQNKLKDIATQFGNFINGAMSEVSFENLGKSMFAFTITFQETVTNLLKSIKFDEVGKNLQTFLMNIPLDRVLQSFINLWMQVGKSLVSVLDKLNFKELGEKVRTAILSVDWKGVWDTIINLFKTSLEGVEEFIDGLFNVDGLGEMVVKATELYVIFKAIDDLGVVSKLINGFSILQGSIEKIGSLLTAIKLSSEGILTTETISEITGVSETLTASFAGISDFFAGLSVSLGTVVGIAVAIVVAILALVEAFTQLYKSSEPFRELISSLFKDIKDTGINLFNQLTDSISALWDTLESFWKNTIEPLFQLLVDICKPFVVAFMKIIDSLWQNILKPLAIFLVDVFKVAIDIVVSAFKLVEPVLSVIINVLSWLWDHILKPIVDFLLDILVSAIGITLDKIKRVINTIKDVVNGVWSFIKSIINSILSGIEWLINKVIGGINSLIRNANKVTSFFKFLGFEIELKELSTVSIPKLETGTNEIPNEGLYHLHPGEAVVPKKYNPALGGNTNDETNERLDSVISLLENMSITNVVNVGNETLYKKQSKFNDKQANKYGTINL